MKGKSVMKGRLIKKYVILSVILSMILLVFPTSPLRAANSGSAISKVESKKKKALKAYAKILHKKKYSNYYFFVCDMNGDKIPELILASEEGTPLAIEEYYTYSKGKAVKLKGPSEKDGYQTWGTLYTMPSRKSYAFYRGGPANVNGMPYSITEYKIKNNKIKMVNYAFKLVPDNGKTKYYYNGKKCTAIKYKKLENAFKTAVDCVYNSKTNRKKYHVN